MKEQNKTPEKELNKMEITNLSDAEFKTLMIRSLKELRVQQKHHGRDEGSAKRNKEKSTGNQQWRG